MVYIEEVRSTYASATYRLVADGDDELQVFATRLGIRPAYIVRVAGRRSYVFVKRLAALRAHAWGAHALSQAQMTKVLAYPTLVIAEAIKQ